jgi:hypothetical protein
MQKETKTYAKNCRESHGYTLIKMMIRHVVLGWTERPRVDTCETDNTNTNIYESFVVG